MTTKKTKGWAILDLRDNEIYAIAFRRSSLYVAKSDFKRFKVVPIAITYNVPSKAKK